ncbi:SLAC1 anion channel family protein [Magnetovibrio sp. PR-2]|uniref:SLAC1 anion channel family protein n=1 Tax=Magnetovibrio sp. PR-2 TaxID=3120356 RepID=UPI002FCDF32B
MTEADQEQQPTRLANMPVSFFAVVMGLSGLTMAWDMAERATIMPFNASPYHALITAAVFMVLLGFYVAKYFLHRGHVKAELNHPVHLTFFPTITISLLLVSVLAFEFDPQMSKYIWLVGAATHLFMTYYVLSAWMSRGHYEIQHLNPAWFIPVVGNIIAPIGGMQHGLVDVSWFFYSIGIVFWLILMVIVFYRIIFHNPIGERLVPTFFILIAPPAVGFISYVSLTGEVDAFATVLFNTALFLTLMQASQFVRFMKLQFFLSWWAYSFPLAAMTVACFLMAEQTGKDWYFVSAMGLFVVLNMVLAYLTVRTIEAMFNNRICITEVPQGK